MLLVCLPVLRRYGYGPPPVHYLGKTATFLLLAAFPVLLLAHAGAGRRAGGRAPIGWALAWWGLVLYWLAGVLYVVQVAAAGRGAARRRAARRDRDAATDRAGSGRRRRRTRPDFLTELFRNPLDPGYADAAARRRRGAARAAAWRRRAGAVAGRWSLVADRVPARGGLPADRRRRAGPQPGPGRPGRRRSASAGGRPTSCSGEADQLRDEVARQRDAALGRRPRRPGCATWRPRTGLARVRGDGVVVTAGRRAGRRSTR